MKKYLPIALMLLFAVTIFSCGDDEEVVDEVWKQQNEEAFKKIEATPGYNKLESQSKNGYILYKVLKKGEGTEPILYTDSVRMYYRGCYIKNSAGQIVEDLTKVTEEGQAFDSNLFEEGLPKDFTVSEVVDGWTTALQYMKQGDRWEVWIPYKLGYGTSGWKGIPGYTTLVFDMEVVKVFKKK